MDWATSVTTIVHDSKRVVVFTWKITPATITITVDNKADVKYRHATPTLTYTVNGLVQGDEALETGLVNISTTRNQESFVGNYPITVSSNRLLDNYIFVFVHATLTVTRAPASDHSGFATPPTPASRPYTPTLTLYDFPLLPATWRWEHPSTGVCNAGINKPFRAVFNPDENNYTDSARDLLITVTKVNLTISAFDQNEIYTNDLINLINAELLEYPDTEIAHTGLLGNDTLASVLELGDGKFKLVVIPTILLHEPDCEGCEDEGINPCDEYLLYEIRIVYTGVAPTNYQIIPNSGTLTVSPDDSLIKPSLQTGQSSFVYRGTNIEPLIINFVNDLSIMGITVESVTIAKNVGTYQIRIELASTLLRWNDRTTGPVILTWHITPAPLIVTAHSHTRIFGTANPVLTNAYTVTGFVGGETASVITGAFDIDTAATPATDVGRYEIEISGTAAAPNYEFHSSRFVSGWLTVIKANAANHSGFTATLSIADQTYSPTFRLSDISALLPSHWRWANPSTHLGAGTHTVRVFFNPDPFNYDDTTAHKDIQIKVNPANVIAPTITGNTFEYNGGVRGPAINHSTDSDLYNVLGITSAITANGYTITFQIKDKLNYEWVGGSTNDIVAQWSITKATLTVTVDSSTVRYCHATPTLTFDVSGFQGGDGMALIAGLLEATTTRLLDSPVGNYPITVSPKGTLTNYVFSPIPATATLTVIKAEASDHGGWNSTPVVPPRGYSPTMTLANINLGNPHWRWETPTMSVARVDEYTVKIFFNPDSTNYNDSYKDISVVIVRAAASENPGYSVPLPIADQTYSPTFTLDDISLLLPANWWWETPSAHLVAGTHNVRVFFNPDSDNYYDSPRIIPVVIKRVQITMPSISGTSREYIGATQGPALNHSAGIAFYEWSGHTARNVNAYNVTFVLKDKNNYAWDSGRIDDIDDIILPWAITQATLTVTAHAVTVNYRHATPELTFTVTGFKGNDGMALVDGLFEVGTNRLVQSNVGGYTITVTPKGTLQNYTISPIPATATLTVAKASASDHEYFDTLPVVAPQTYSPGMTLGASGISLGAFWHWETASDLVGNVGVRPVGVYFNPDSDNYENAYTYVDIRINRIIVAVPTLSEYTFVFDGDTKVPQILHGIAGFGDYDFYGDFGRRDVGRYTILFQLYDRINYQWDNDSNSEFVILTWNITHKFIEMPVFSMAFGYTGYEHKITVQQVIGDCTDIQIVNTTSTMAATDVETYTITVALVDAMNTRWLNNDVPEGTHNDLEFFWTIERALLTIVINDQTRQYGTIYGASNHMFTSFMVIGLRGTDTIEDHDFDLDFVLKTTADGNDPAIVGVYSIFKDGDATAMNYDILFMSGILRVIHAPGLITGDDIPTATGTHTYGTRLSQWTLSPGWSWINAQEIPDRVNTGYRAAINVNSLNPNYDWSVVSGYNGNQIIMRVWVDVERADYRVRDIDVVGNAQDGNRLLTIGLTGDWRWVDNNTTLVVGENIVSIYLDVSGLVDNYDFTGVEGFDEETLRIIRTIVVTVEPKKSGTTGGSKGNNNLILWIAIGAILLSATGYTLYDRMKKLGSKK